MQCSKSLYILNFVFLQQCVMLFEVFDIEYHRRCIYDKLIINDSGNQKVLCGNGVMKNLTSR